MKRKKYSRREFIKKNSITGLGAAFTLGVAPSLVAKSLSLDHLFSENRQDRLYFDAFTRIGPRRHKHPQARWSLDHLLDEMNHCSISGALVSYTLSVNYDPMYS